MSGDIDLKKLYKPFSAKDINWRVQRCGITSKGKPWAMVLAYIDGRAVMNRLDRVCKPQNWQDKIRSLENGKTFCELSIKIDGEWVTKTGVADETNIEGAKGGASDALKRAGVKWGIGRYLYKLDEDFAECTTEKRKGWYRGKVSKKNNKQNNKRKIIYWQEPELPKWALPKEGK